MGGSILGAGVIMRAERSWGLGRRYRDKGSGQQQLSSNSLKLDSSTSIPLLSYHRNA